MPTSVVAAPTPHRSRVTRGILLYAAAWLPLAVAYVGALTWTSGGELPITAVVVAALMHTLGPALLGVGIWRLTARMALSSPLSARFVGAHLAAAALFVGAWMAWEMALSTTLDAARAPSPVLWSYLLPWQGFLGLMLYGVVAAASYAVRGAFQVHDLEVKAAHAQRLRAEAELAALRAHLNPHFLFNTLHGVMQLLREDPAQAEQALERLAELLRFVLRLDRTGTRSIALEEEWQFVQSYLWLEQLRLGCRLHVESSVDDDALACAVPPFTLQPLVENAIKHGIGPRPAGGRLTVQAVHTGTHLHIVVADNGGGAAVIPDENTPGLGLPAVRRRLQSFFGESNVEFAIVTSPGAGFAVRLVVPAQPLDMALEAGR
ncbi:MAG: histidine kinase [Gemmatimonadaceae bacterium]|nr:histidine kinase [Gemmatimonadaceae bacterium]